mmetsp:Transcript_20800/g.46565  ORF Transcript_20800/g.46565 Transcript_20800/m.46565 type:complete len:205 (+) Transcript_20800:30-644(+)
MPHRSLHGSRRHPRSSHLPSHACSCLPLPVPGSCCRLSPFTYLSFPHLRPARVPFSASPYPFLPPLTVSCLLPLSLFATPSSPCRTRSYATNASHRLEAPTALATPRRPDVRACVQREGTSFVQHYAVAGVRHLLRAGRIHAHSNDVPSGRLERRQFFLQCCDLLLRCRRCREVARLHVGRLTRRGGRHPLLNRSQLVRCLSEA